MLTLVIIFGLAYLGREAVSSRNIPVFVMPRMGEFLRNNGPWDQLLDLKNIELINLDNDGNGFNIELSSDLFVSAFTVPHRDEYSETVGFRISTKESSAIYLLTSTVCLTGRIILSFISRPHCRNRLFLFGLPLE